MIEWLGIDHLFELSRTDAIAGFLTPLAIFAAFFLAQRILPARRVPGYVINQETGKPRKYQAERSSLDYRSRPDLNANVLVLPRLVGHLRQAAAPLRCVWQSTRDSHTRVN